MLSFLDFIAVISITGIEDKLRKVAQSKWIHKSKPLNLFVVHNRNSNLAWLLQPPTHPLFPLISLRFDWNLSYQWIAGDTHMFQFRLNSTWDTSSISFYSWLLVTSKRNISISPLSFVILVWFYGAHLVWICVRCVLCWMLCVCGWSHSVCAVFRANPSQGPLATTHKSEAKLNIKKCDGNVCNVCVRMGIHVFTCTTTQHTATTTIPTTRGDESESWQIVVNDVPTSRLRYSRQVKKFAIFEWWMWRCLLCCCRF